MNEIAQILYSAADLVDKGWCQKSSARDINLNPVSPWSSNARYFCAHGAINAITRCGDRDQGFGEDAHFCAVSALKESLGSSCLDSYDGIFRWNDNPQRTAPEVSALLRETAKNVQASSG